VLKISKTAKAWDKVLAPLIIAVTRTALDDKTLQDELTGYQDHARRAPYRLIPGIY